MKIYNKKGEEINNLELARLHSLDDYRIVAQDHLSNGYYISTVWLGLDHSFGTGAPLIFETMVFLSLADGSTDFSGLETYRYETEEAAIKGHEETLLRVVKYIRM